MRRIARSHFRPERLPPARTFYEGVFGQLRRASRGWTKVLCCFHPDHNPSLAINVETGVFKCWSCGAHGSGLVDFVMLRDNVKFKTAVQALGAWGSAGERLPLRTVPIRFLVLDFVIDGVSYRNSKEVQDEPKNDLQRMRWIHAEAKDRLAEIHQGDNKRFEGEEETQWGILAASWELIQMEEPDGV